MDPRRSAPRSPRTRAERQRETREALVIAARESFARDGYHAASLEGIAADAGFSKGAVYSNFEGKAALFLAVMDDNLEKLRGSGWDPLSAVEADGTGEPKPAQDPHAARLVRGIGLATLEFIATAARDDDLISALRERMQVMIGAYERLATEARPAGENLPADDVARLMTALDQGVSVLALSGITSMDTDLMRAGLRRLSDPAAAASDPAPERHDGPVSFPGVELVHRLIREADGA
ncbi:MULTISPECIES: TetR/AcrR family transcriptional regulator [unclassified Microbacterium]|uniref:TetR/AcrR family transcriptional regulator n=1 Tax=unclassified Microbacterium TaxID=2609290 RepID=UPI000EA8B426|nr:MULTISPECIES: TetR/AcrR family transcriptional regulator [unclassified Microbacterium]MBT2483479.1 TetR/AcrR family transcriptional regulator [Microbacterium sp. ISL-108]RKN66498.1 TetR/AcrR family transcriptional regulator [Microbacterium sp. CGR2]